MQKKERIAQLLANGVAASDISSIVGCSVQYLASLKADPEFKDFLSIYQDAAAEETKQVEDERLDDKYVGLEHKLVKNLSDNAGLLEAAQAIRLLQNVSERNDKRRAGLAQQGGGNGGQLVHVTINVPPAALSEPGFVMTAQKEVVSVGTRALAPMSMDNVSDLIEAKRIQRDLPQAGYSALDEARLIAEM